MWFVCSFRTMSWCLSVYHCCWVLRSRHCTYCQTFQCTFAFFWLSFLSLIPHVCEPLQVAVTNDWNSRVVLVDTNLSKGKWYWEAKITNLSGSCSLGVIIQGFLSSEAYSGIGCDPRGCSWGMQGPSGSVFYKGAAQSSSYWFDSLHGRQKRGGCVGVAFSPCEA